MHVALYQPKIPPNTGNIARQCVGMGMPLHLIGPVGFDLDDGAVRRAGLDHWPHLTLTVHESPDAFCHWLGARQPWLVTKFGQVRYDHAAYDRDDVLLFGSEIDGLPESWRQRWARRTIYIPIMGPVRSYNLSNAASIVMAQACSTAGIFPTHKATSATSQ